MIALLTTEDVAEYAKVKVKTVYHWIKNGAKGKRLKCHRLPGGGYRIDPHDLSEFLGFEVSRPTMQPAGKA